MTKSSGEACTPSGPCSMPAVSAMSRVSSPPNPLVISVSLPERRTMTVCGSPVPCIALAEAFGNREHRGEDDDDARDADDGDDGGAQALGDRPQRDAGDGDGLRQPVHVRSPISSGAGRRRSSCGSPEAPAAGRCPRRARATSAAPRMRSRGGKWKIGSSPPVGSPPTVIAVHDSSKPSPPPTTAIVQDSSSTSDEDAAVAEAERLEHAELVDALAHRLRHGVARRRRG